MCCRNATSILGQFTLLDCHLHQQHKLLRPSATGVGQLNSLAKSHHPGPDLQRLSSIASATLERQVNGPMTGEWLLLTGSLPSTWPLQLQLLQLVQNNFSGTLPSTGWPAQLQVLDAQLNRLTGSILPELSCLSQLQQLRLPDNNLTGTLPAAWGGPDAFPAGLQVLQVSGNALTGTLPGNWANRKAFQEIQYLELQDTHMAGSLPESWSWPGAFPNLRELTISALGLNGSIPAGRGSHRAFQNMEILVITDARLSGHVPAFNNAILNTLILTNLGLSSGLEVFWNSSAPLALGDLANNSINGQVPDVPQALRSVVGLDLSQNSLQGTVPVPWLQAGNFLSHVSYLNLGQAWDNSVMQNDWRQTLCLHEDLYRADVTGRQLPCCPSWFTSLVGQDAETAGTDTSAGVQEGLSETAAFALIYTFDQGANQSLSVSTICANPSATRVLLIVWPVFAGCCLAMLALYACWQRWLVKQSGSMKRFLPLFAALQTMYSMFSGLGGLAFYYYNEVPIHNIKALGVKHRCPSSSMEQMASKCPACNFLVSFCDDWRYSCLPWVLSVGWSEV